MLIENIKDKNMKVSFDFDGTLSKKKIQSYAKSLIKRGYDVRITTARYDEDNKHLWATNPTNECLYKVVDDLKIPRKNIQFMNMKDKASYFKNNPDFLFHLDDDWLELAEIRKFTNVPAINCFGNENWKEECEKALKNKK